MNRNKLLIIRYLRNGRGERSEGGMKSGKKEAEEDWE